MAEKKSAAKPASPKDECVAMKPHELMLLSTSQNAAAMEKFSVWGDADIVGLIDELKVKAIKIQDGDMKPVEAMLYGQAQALQSIFTNMARRSAMNAGEYINASETYMKLALKAQSQCRATLETLAIVKNPQPYIRQANMTTGPQQVNNSYASASEHQGIQSGAGDFQSQPNELLERQHANILDTGAPSQASRVNQTVETMGKVDRPKVKRG